MSNLETVKTNVDVFGLKFSANHKEKATADLERHLGWVSLTFSNIDGRQLTTPVNTNEKCGVEPLVFMEKFNTAFKLHNDAVDKYFKELKESTIEKIKVFCHSTNNEKRKKFVEESFQSGLYDIELNDGFIRFNKCSILYYERLTEILYGKSFNNPVVFEITEEEFNELEKMYLKF